ncbi:fasciclin domain-containing protein [Streptomyces sp. NPDC020917]|uniref:fasciclin domain-containing protein n=1 Tax=Streptomyces sp. NPDC020917 TaxID=3365102 RepID=UPI0037A484B2
MSRTTLTTALAAAAVAVPLSLGGLAPQAYAQTGSPSPSPTGTATTAPGIFGPGCSTLPRTGAGSTAVMARQRLVTAAAGNPQLSTLVGYINRARIVNVLDTTNNITLFAPTNAAWNKLSSTQRANLLNNPTQLKKVLNYHVVNQHITKAELPGGSFTTREGSKLTTSGSGTTFKVNNTADIVCGNIPTANATVYLVDSVLMPPS